ncbi:MAG: manganese efflux pump, partial [Patescibacteria group bacterium]
MVVTTGDVLTFLAILVGIMLVVVLYNVLLLFVDVRRIVKRADRLTERVESIVMKPLSIATSIDAFAVGLSMSILGVSIWQPALIIGMVACLVTACGMHLGRWLGANSRIGNYADILGGTVLLAIGANLLHSHGIL